MYDLKEIFKSITPDNIQNVQVVNDMMNVFIEILQERSKESINLFDYKENKEIRKQYIKTYLRDLYDVLDGVKTNQKLIDLIESRNAIYNIPGFEFISREVLEDMINRISDEHFIAFRGFREKKGTIPGIEFIFHLIATLVNTPEGVDYIIIEGKNPFELYIEGTLPPEFYYYLVAPLAHPAGFTYSYVQAVVWELIDYYFNTRIEYNVRELSVNCISYNPDNPNISIRNSTDFSDREVIDIKEKNYVWPRSTRIYFGGEFLGEYLEHLEYANGHNTVTLNNESGIIKQFGDFCTIYRVIEETLIEDLEIDDLLTEVHSYFTTKYPEIMEDLDILEAKSEDRTPYLSWERVPFWDIIGSTPYTKNWNSYSCYRDSYNESKDTVHHIGDDHMYIWGKSEIIGSQYLNEGFDDDIPNRYNPYETDSNFIPESLETKYELFGYTEYKGRKTLLTQPGKLRDYAYINGDAFHMTYVSEPVKINGFKVRDEIGSFIISEPFEINNNVIVNGFIVRDDDFSYTLHNGVDYEYEHIGYPIIGEINLGLNALLDIYGDIVKCNDFWSLKYFYYYFDFFVRICETYKNSYGQIDPLIGDAFYKLGDYELISGSSTNKLTPGFWNNGFHSESETFEFGVFRNGKLIPDNNVGIFEEIDFQDEYEYSYEYTINLGDLTISEFDIGIPVEEWTKVFTEESDSKFGFLINGEDVNNIQIRELDLGTKYSNSFEYSILGGQLNISGFDIGKEEFIEIEHFNEYSDWKFNIE